MSRGNGMFFPVPRAGALRACIPPRPCRVCAPARRVRRCHVRSVCGAGCGMFSCPPAQGRAGGRLSVTPGGNRGRALSAEAIHRVVFIPPPHPRASLHRLPLRLVQLCSLPAVSSGSWRCATRARRALRTGAAPGSRSSCGRIAPTKRTHAPPGSREPRASHHTSLKLVLSGAPVRRVTRGLQTRQGRRC